MTDYACPQCNQLLTPHALEDGWCMRCATKLPADLQAVAKTHASTEPEPKKESWWPILLLIVGALTLGWLLGMAKFGRLSPGWTAAVLAIYGVLLIARILEIWMNWQARQDGADQEWEDRKK
jgi:hypothetical protein